MREQARYLMSMRESEENDETLVKIEKKLSNIERRLSYIEEQNNEIKNEMRTSGTKMVHVREPVLETSSESGIEDEPETDHLYDSSGTSHVHFEAIPESAEAIEEVTEEDVDGDGVVQEDAEKSVSKVEIISKETKEEVPKLADEALADVRVFDILKHEGCVSDNETMVRLFKDYPEVHRKARSAWDESAFQTAHAMTLGVPRKIRRKKTRSYKNQLKQEMFEQELMSTPVTPDCKRCACELTSMQHGREIFTLPLRETRLSTDPVKHSFPSRKQRNPKLNIHPPVECDCRQDVRASKGMAPLLSVTGTQVPLCDRSEYYFF